LWLDLEHPYITLDNSYIESCWWVIKQLWDQGLVYQGYKVTPHCPRCGTSLSSHEVALGYDEHAEDPSVYIKFRLAVNSLKKSNLSEERAQKLQSLMSDKPSIFWHGLLLPGLYPEIPPWQYQRIPNIW
jgi:isoleucyl-tRNA synthetase